MPDLEPGPWDGGPLGEQAREAITARSDAIARWIVRYRELLAAAESRPWVPTHGEPHGGNQIVTPSGLDSWTGSRSRSHRASATSRR